MSKITKDVNDIVSYAIFHQLIHAADAIYATNRIFDLLLVDEYETFQYQQTGEVEEPSEILEPILNYAAQKGIIHPDTVTRRDIFEAKLMDVLLPRPSELNRTFYDFNKSEEATDYYYQLSQKSNYIKTSRTSKNVIWKSPTKYGVLDMTINLSKPEKDPRDIIAAGKTTTNKYPKCLLCEENVGYNGNATNVGRTSHRIIPIDINNENFYLQYSPYVYYNEHCIVLKKEHEPMNVTIHTFKRLFDFVDQFPHYFLGSNAGLPIVGGSILSHEHYQGGRHTFPIEHADVLQTVELEGIKLERLFWPLSVLRLSSKDKNLIIKTADKVFKFWENYSDQSAGIHAYTGYTPHNAITPIARKKDGVYILDMTLRNNRTSEDYPLGIFHPHKEHHHIKKENIGLIEVMGLAVLPARLNKELPFIQKALEEYTELPEELSYHKAWVEELKEFDVDGDVEAFIKDQIAVKFMKVIEDAGVFKQTQLGQQQFNKFVKELVYVLNQ